MGKIGSTRNIDLIRSALLTAIKPAFNTILIPDRCGRMSDRPFLVMKPAGGSCAWSVNTTRRGGRGMSRAAVQEGTALLREFREPHHCPPLPRSGGPDPPQLRPGY